MRKTVSINLKDFYKLISCRFKHNSKNLKYSMKKSPYYKCPGCSMPKAAYSKNYHKVDKLSDIALSVSAKGNVEIISKPCR